ncbi:phosphatases II [Serendipita vermifera]|nr:phosphatases II [Serendipita vermifera]
MSHLDGPEMAAKYPLWLPRPLTEGYIQKVETELYRREILRRKNHAPGTALTPQFARYCSSAGLDPVNVRANRYTDIYPYDKSRVVLPSGAYLNASWVKERAGGKWMVATQAPLERTAHTFLSMFLEPVTPSQNVESPPTANRLRTIVQLTPNVEGNTAKAFQYFPRTVGEEMIWPPPNQVLVPPIKVKLLQMSSPEDGAGDLSWIHSVLELSYEDGQSPKHLVRHIHYLDWPDHGVPENARSLLQFMQFVEACNKDSSHIDASKNPDPPIVVGCSAGVGRTGTFIALASLFRSHNLNRPTNLSNQEKSDSPEADWSGDTLPASPFGPLPEEIQNDLIALEVDYLRDQRPLMVQSRGQLRFLYQVFPAVMQLERSGDSN